MGSPSPFPSTHPHSPPCPFSTFKSGTKPLGGSPHLQEESKLLTTASQALPPAATHTSPPAGSHTSQQPPCPPRTLFRTLPVQGLPTRSLTRSSLHPDVCSLSITSVRSSQMLPEERGGLPGRGTAFPALLLVHSASFPPGLAHGNELFNCPTPHPAAKAPALRFDFLCGCLSSI